MTNTEASMREVHRKLAVAPDGGYMRVRNRTPVLSALTFWIFVREFSPVPPVYSELLVNTRVTVCHTVTRGYALGL